MTKDIGLDDSEQQLCSMYPAQPHSDYIIADYMDKIATRINILETELKFAWSALDLMSSEYGKMWTRLEKLENISMEQKSVVANLMGLYGATSLNATAQQQQRGQGPANFPTAADFTDMMGDLRNEALGGAYDTVDGNAPNYEFARAQSAFTENKMNLDGAMTANRISADIRHLQEQQKQIEHNIQHNERLFDELNALSYSAHAPNQSILDGKMTDAPNSHSLRELLGSGCIKDGLEEGIDLVQRERLKQQYGDQTAANFLMYRNLMQTETQNKRTDADFFRSGEINRDLYSNQIDANAPNIFEDLIRLEQQQQKNKLLSIGSDGNIIEIILPSDNVYEQAAGISRPVSSLGMIYEDNEEQELEHQSSASEVDELRLYADDSKKDSSILSPSKKDPGRKSKKKKSHRKHETDSSHSFLNGDSTKKERPISPVKMTKDETVTFIMEEISKIEDLSLFTNEQFSSLKELISNEFTFFNKINQNNKHLLLILLNPITSSDAYESTQAKCDQIMQKLRKNMTILHTMLDNKDDLSDIKPNEAIDIDEILETSSIIDDDSRSEKRQSSSDLPKMLNSKRYDPLKTKNDNYYSQNLIRNNFSLNEQLKLLDSRESEIICKKSIKSITEELEASERKNLLDNFDENAILSSANRTQSLCHLSSIRNDSYQYSSNSSIYSNDEYIKSLKKSLERHNSMLFLLHLQNSNYQSSNDIRTEAKETPSGI